MLDLNERMLKTVAGQITWADPEIGKNCRACKHCEPHPKPKPRRPDQCKLVKAMTNKIGEPFNGDSAIACSKFDQAA